MITNIALTHSTTLWEWHLTFYSSLFVCIIHTKVNHSYLWSITMCDNNLVSFFNKINYRLCSFFYEFKLFECSVAKCVSAKCDYNFFRHIMLLIKGGRMPPLLFIYVLFLFLLLQVLLK